MTPNEELEHLDAELERLRNEHSNTAGVLRLTDKCLRRCSKWKWEQHGWTISAGQSCSIMNGNERARRIALMSVLKGHIHESEFVSGLERLEVVLGPSGSEPTQDRIGSMDRRTAEGRIDGPGSDYSRSPCGVRRLGQPPCETPYSRVE